MRVLRPTRRTLLFAIIQAAGWPIYFLLAVSIIAVALIIERFIILRKEKIVPSGLLESVLVAYETATGKEQWRTNLGREPRGIAVSADGARALIAYRPPMPAGMTIRSLLVARSTPPNVSTSSDVKVTTVSVASFTVWSVDLEIPDEQCPALRVHPAEFAQRAHRLRHACARGAGPRGQVLLGDRRADGYRILERLPVAFAELHDPGRQAPDRVGRAELHALERGLAKPGR